MSVTVDANILVYASNEGDPLNARARALLEELAMGPQLAYLFWPVVFRYLRIVTHARVLPRPLTPAEATQNVGELLSRSNVRTTGEANRFWDVYRDIAGDDTRGNHVPDAHLAALMRQHEVAVIYTRDRDFRRYPGIEARDPFA